HARGGEGEGYPGAEEARGHATDVRRVDRLAQLSRLVACGALEEALQGDSLHRQRGEGAQRGPLWPREDQGAHPRVPGRTAACEESEGVDSLLRRASGRRQDLARYVNCEGDGAEVCSALTRRHSRRGRDSWSPPHVHR